MNISYRLIHSVSELPDSWDSLALNYFQRREFLAYAEKFNPCRQRYWLSEESGVLKAGAVLYTLRLDLLTFLHLKSPVEMNIAGIPCSVSCPGFIGADKFVLELQNHIYSVQKGFVLFLNLENETPGIKHAHGHTLPTVILENRFPHWEDYVSALRTDYRRRLMQILNSTQDIQLETLPCNDFTSEMYKMYLAVYEKSNAKLEKLSSNFFRNLPEPFRLTVCKKEGRIIGWNITLFHEKTIFFFLGGVDYRMNRACNTYLRLLINIVREGISKNAETIDLGQTAEIPKMRLGGICKKRFMEARHSSLLLNQLIIKAQSMMSYKRNVPQVHVFKEGAA